MHIAQLYMHSPTFMTASQPTSIGPHLSNEPRSLHIEKISPSPRPGIFRSLASLPRTAFLTLSSLSQFFFFQLARASSSEGKGMWNSEIIQTTVDPVKAGKDGADDRVNSPIESTPRPFASMPSSLRWSVWPRLYKS